MIRHIVMWKFIDDLSAIEKQELALNFKYDMERLTTIVDGILRIEVVVNALDTSNMDMMLISEFKDKDVLGQYQNHQKHKDATKCLNKMVSLRSCVDYEDA